MVLLKKLNRPHPGQFLGKIWDNCNTLRPDYLPKLTAADDQVVKVLHNLRRSNRTHQPTQRFDFNVDGLSDLQRLSQSNEEQPPEVDTKGNDPVQPEGTQEQEMDSDSKWLTNIQQAYNARLWRVCPGSS